MSNKKKRNAPHNLQNLQQKLNPIIELPPKNWTEV